MKKGVLVVYPIILASMFFLLSPPAAGQVTQDSIRKNWSKYQKTVLYDFDNTTSGWEDCESKTGVLSGLTVERTADMAMTEAERKVHGAGALRLTLNAQAGKRIQGMLCATLFDTDWSDIVAVQFDVFLPEGAPSGLAVAPYFMSEQWKKWSQDPVETKLVPGKWVTVTCYLSTLANINMAKITTAGTWIWGTPSAAYTGPVYVDNFTAYSTKPLAAKPVLKTLAVKKTVPAEIMVDATMYGGEVSKYLLSVNTGGNITDPVMRDYLKAMGPGGFFRTWGWPVPGDRFNPSKGVYDWSQGDAIIRSVLDAGWEPLVTLGQCPEWMAAKNEKGEPKRNGPPRDPNDWAAMAADVVRHYNKDLKYGIKYWEIWNEPDIFFWGGTEAEYNALVKAAAEAMKKVDPSIKVIAGAWANCWAPSSSRLKSLMSLKPKIDYISYHNYLTGNPKETEAAIFSKTGQLMQAPVYKGRKYIRSVLKELGAESSYPGIDLMMTEMNIHPDTTYDPRVETSLYPVWWATAYYNYIHQNLMCGVYFEYGSWVWGLINKGPRPTWYLFPLLKLRARIDGARWVKVTGERPDLKVLGLKQDDRFCVVIINNTQSNVQYRAGLELKGVAGVKEFTVYRISETENGEKPVGTVPFAGKINVDCAPYTVTLLQGMIAPGTPAAAMARYDEEPSVEALGFSASGQYSFAGEKAEFSRAAGPVKVDANLREYSACKPIPVDGSRVSSGTKADWKGASDASAAVRVMYDRDNLYFGVEVKDDALVFSKEWPWSGDSIELFLGTHHMHLSRTEKGDYDYQIMLCMDGGKFKPGASVIQFLGGTGGGTRDKAAVDSEIAVKKTAGGYVLEARISRKNFYEVSEFKPGMEVRFDIGIDDADDPAKGRKVQLMWNAADPGVWNSPDLWGVAVLK